MATQGEIAMRELSTAILTLADVKASRESLTALSDVYDLLQSVERRLEKVDAAKR